MRSHEPAAGEVSSALVARVLDLPMVHRRRLVAIAGAPASGKTTLAASLTEALRVAGARAECVPMDGFHLDNRVLDARGLRARKGAPETFDVFGFRALMQRLQQEEDVIYPVFDRALDLSVAGAGCVTSACDLVIVEGNYLLFDEAPWSQLPELWALSLWVDVSEARVLERCIQRWIDHGHSPEEARQRAEANDVRNARRIMGARLPADHVIKS